VLEQLNRRVIEPIFGIHLKSAENAQSWKWQRAQRFNDKMQKNG
jgi:hypothetical protein